MLIEAHGAITRGEDGATIALMLDRPLEEVPDADWRAATRGISGAPDYWIVEAACAVIVWRVGARADAAEPAAQG